MVAGYATVTSNVLDRLMDRATGALQGTRYFEAERLSRRALLLGHARHDYDRMARILLPLQEARRQKRQIACDAGSARVVSKHPRGAPAPGCWLVQPPLVATDARRLRERADARRAPVFVMAREPTTRAGLWPITAVAAPASRRARWPRVVRMVVMPPGETGDASTVPQEWFEAAAEALGDAAIRSVCMDLHPAWRVDDLLILLDAIPEHEKLHQRLADACRDALTAEPPPKLRPREFGETNCF